jgi:hypothetical protein
MWKRKNLIGTPPPTEFSVGGSVGCGHALDVIPHRVLKFINIDRTRGAVDGRADDEHVRAYGDRVALASQGGGGKEKVVESFKKK